MDFQTIAEMHVKLGVHKLGVADIFYVHNAHYWEGYERSIKSPSENHLIHILVITHAASCTRLQIQSSDELPNTNYMKVATKNVKTIWEVMFFLSCLSDD